MFKRIVEIGVKILQCVGGAAHGNPGRGNLGPLPPRAPVPRPGGPGTVGNPRYAGAIIDLLRVLCGAWSGDTVPP